MNQNNSDLIQRQPKTAYSQSHFTWASFLAQRAKQKQKYLHSSEEPAIS